ncbi:PadR family transcriptional regulator [Nonomuraea longispora]|uniref:PadR family transcriptional regulator n=1 Tax=Nonomuraea longispora TaxID=1848320 RepID=A0A4R4MW85_9ACTN|nr:PadR family transcriptional regulator [Nonomuraea longispora]TDC00438.1 PadR family transcriptional regulator [Nonomuraea longispora]
MSSIRIFILGALHERGSMHGHQLKLLAEQEHVDLWTDITVGGLYGAIKRLATEGLIEEARVERDGAYPQRRVWAITGEGRVVLSSLRLDGLREIVFRADPFDLAVTRLDPDNLEVLPDVIGARLGSLRAMLADHDVHMNAVTRYLSRSEVLVLKHRAARLRTEIAWHEELAEQLPQIIADERTKKDTP